MVCVMTKKTVNIILMLFAAVWALLSVVIMIYVICSGLPPKEMVFDIVQALLLLSGSLWLFLHIRKRQK